MFKPSPNPMQVSLSLVRSFRQSREGRYRENQARDREELDLLQYENSKRRDKLIKAKQKDMARKARLFGAEMRAYR